MTLKSICSDTQIPRKGVPSDFQERVEIAAQKIVELEPSFSSKEAVRIAVSHVMQEIRREHKIEEKIKQGTMNVSDDNLL